MREIFLTLLLVLVGTAAQAAGELEAARDAASRDDHGRAIGLYEQAFAADPGLADTCAGELALQYTWNDQPGAAIPWYERQLDTTPIDIDTRLGLARALSWNNQLEEAWFQYRVVYYLEDGNLEARRGEARMLAWMDDNDRSLAMYDAILVDHPDDIPTRIERAQVVNWRGDHFEAAHLYKEILEDDPGNAEATVGLAQSLRWSGQERLAMSTLDPIRDNPAAAPLYRDLELAARPYLEFNSARAVDSDDLEVFGNELSWTRNTSVGSLNNPRTRLGLRHERLWQPGQPDIQDWKLSFGGSAQTSRRTTLNAYLGLWNFRSDGTIVDSGQTGDLDWTLLTWDAWWTWLARNDLRVDFSTDRDYVQTPRAMGYETSLTQLGASADWRLAREWSVSGLLREGFYSDGNHRFSTEARTRWQRNHTWSYWVSPRLSAFWISDPKNRGYWNPSDFYAAGVDVGIMRTFNEKWTPRLELATSREWEEGNGYGVFAGSAGILWSITRTWELDLGGGVSDSRLSTSSGYGRDWVALTLRWRY